ncbi:MAG: ADP-ribosylglycohydrolase family protein [Myxococcaceae bacterium]|nr:ADP-ribosylglycohydrolase family protein [Myxococcaceae bacterium]
MTSRDDRARGCLWGLAWGDVFGAPIESWSADEIATTFGAYEALPESYAQVKMSRRRRLRPQGLHTDDTQQAVTLLAVCLGEGGFSPEAWGRALVRGRALKAWRGTGKQFENAVTRLEDGGPARSTGSPSAGIGAAMRTAVLGALFHDDATRLDAVACESAAVTHGDVRAIVLSHAVAFAAARLVRGESPAQVRQALPDAVAELETTWLDRRNDWIADRSGGRQVSDTLRPLLRALPVAPMDVARRVLELGAGFLAPGAPPAHPNHAFALLGGHFALGMALRDDVDPFIALRDIVRLGEDTDTVAAIAGGLLGARFGHGWIPKPKVLDHDRLGAWADALVTRSAPESLDSLLSREAQLTAHEKEFQALGRG